MNIELGKKAKKQSISDFGVIDATVHWNLNASTLAEMSVKQ